MRNQMKKVALAAAVVALLALRTTVEAGNPMPTTITVPNLCCQGCVKKAASQLSAVPGVGTVQANLQAKQLVVLPKPDMTPSPRGMWESLEKVNKTPSRLEGPSGTFTQKPDF